MLEIRDLELVRTVVSEGNFARAARVLGLGQPVLSRRIADLEHRLGGPLFLRGHAGAEPTDLCRALMIDAEEILARMQALSRRLSETRGHQTAELRIAAGSFVCETSVLPAAAAMFSLTPELRVSIAAMTWKAVAVAVRGRDAELGVLEVSDLGDDTADLVIEPLREHPAFFAARAGHPLAGRAGLTLAEILAFPLIMIGRVPQRFVAVFAAAREEARATGTAHPAFPALLHESPSVALRAAAASDAIVGVTASIAAFALLAGEMTVLPWHEPWTFLRFGIIQVRGRRLPAAAGQFVEALRQADEAAFEAGLRLLARVQAAQGGGGLPREA